MAELRDRYEAMRGSGAELAAFSADEPGRSRALKEQLRLPFTLLCDPGRELIRALDVLNPHEAGGIAIPSLTIVDRELRVLFRSVDSMMVRVSADETVRLLREAVAGRFGGDGSGARPAASRRAPVWASPMDILRATGNLVRRGFRSPGA